MEEMAMSKDDSTGWSGSMLPGVEKRQRAQPHSTAPQTPLADREAAVVASQHAADKRNEKADRRQETADLRQTAADQRQESADLRQETADLRQETADLRQVAAELSDETARVRAELSAVTEDQLREANERLIVATLRAQEMTEAAEGSAARMSHMAEHDFLTGLPNRSLLSARLAQSIALAQRHGKRVALLFLDIDHFKHINDSLGHAVGDRLLQSAAARLQSCIRTSDTICRQGGDEFVVLLAEIESPQDAALAAEKLIAAMSDPYLVDGHRLHATLSIGISIYPDDGQNVEAVLSNADVAMYHAKESGRNKYQLFTADMNIRAAARQQVQEALHQALEQQRFVVHYQPKVDLESGTITGAEALIRMRQAEDHQLVGPDHFVNIAEDCGLILPMGRWILHEACRQTRAWQREGARMGQIAVNVSAIEFHSKGFIAGVQAVLDETGLDPRCLEIELTENVLMHDSETTTAVLNALKEMGVQLAIDDFGTGYSSLSYLRRFPIDTIKIDQSFVQDIHADTEEAAIVSAIIAMGKSLKLRVVAEGIETKHQLDFLQSLECAEGQGYFFGKPVSAVDFGTLLGVNA
jgi:diguanylate cyclase (GGDEF)-like protein